MRDIIGYTCTGLGIVMEIESGNIVIKRSDNKPMHDDEARALMEALVKKLRGRKE